MILFVVFALGMAYVTYLACTYGDPYVILYGKDYLGNRCGRGEFSNRSKVIFPRIDKDLIDQAHIATTSPWNLVFYGICVEECPDVTDPKNCLSDMDSCIVRDYGTEEQWTAAGGSSYYFQVLPTLLFSMVIVALFGASILLQGPNPKSKHFTASHRV